jgi:hypothetical protein
MDSARLAEWAPERMGHGHTSTGAIYLDTSAERRMRQVFAWRTARTSGELAVSRD